jgi:hypothetical protein
MDESIEERLTALEARLARMESLQERSALDLDAAKSGVRSWVTEYVSLRLQQLVPETCEHEPAPDAARSCSRYSAVAFRARSVKAGSAARPSGPTSASMPRSTLIQRRCPGAR